MALRLVPDKVAKTGSGEILDQMAKERDKPAVLHQIDENLKRVYEEALEQDLPDRFTELLSQLRAKGASK